MALRAITPSQEAYCAECHVKLSLDETSCPHCGKDFTGVIDAGLCGHCGTVVPVSEDKCSMCGAMFNPVNTQTGFNETEYLRRMLHWRSLKADQRATSLLQQTVDPSISLPSVITSPFSPEPINILYQLAEPLDKVLKLRKRRLQQMDGLIAEAKQRIDELGEASDPLKQKEKSRLRRWIDETEAEREDLSTIETSMVEMEKIYKNLLTLQQVEMQTKEESIRMRLDSVGTELERMEREKMTIQEREDEIQRKEDELRQILERIGEKEKELSSLERLLTQRVAEAEQQKKKLEDTEKQLEKDKWLSAQKDIQSQLISMKTSGGTAPSKQESLEIESRLRELEEQNRRLDEQNRRIHAEKDEMKNLLRDIGKLFNVLDDLLGKLPEEVIDKFAKSDDFSLYETILQKCRM